MGDSCQQRDYTQTIRDYKGQKVARLQGAADYKTAWEQLANSHYADIRHRLNNIANMEYYDYCERISDTTPLLLGDYLRHYDANCLDAIKQDIEATRAGLQYLEAAIDAEITRRH